MSSEVPLLIEDAVHNLCEKPYAGHQVCINLRNCEQERTVLCCKLITTEVPRLHLQTSSIQQPQECIFRWSYEAVMLLLVYRYRSAYSRIFLLPNAGKCPLHREPSESRASLSRMVPQSGFPSSSSFSPKMRSLSLDLTHTSPSDAATQRSVNQQSYCRIARAKQGEERALRRVPLVCSW